jgi:hypothetical protein
MEDHRPMHRPPRRPATRHFPRPLQVPSPRTQLHAVSLPGKTHCADLPVQADLHVPCPSQTPRPPWGVSPGGMGEQLPKCPATSQASQVPAQEALVQQTPSTHDAADAPQSALV